MLGIKQTTMTFPGKLCSAKRVVDPNSRHFLVDSLRVTSVSLEPMRGGCAVYVSYIRPMRELWRETQLMWGEIWRKKEVRRRWTETDAEAFQTKDSSLHRSEETSVVFTGR